MRSYEIRFDLPRSRQEIYAFVSNVENLDRMTPDWLRFDVIGEPPASLETGTTIDYRLRWRGLPLRWQSEITVWEPLEVFTYEQRRGPYRAWIHEHFFEPTPSGTRVIDRVDFSTWADRLLGRRVERDVERIFEHRAAYLRRRFGGG